MAAPVPIALGPLVDYLLDGQSGNGHGRREAQKISAGKFRMARITAHELGRIWVHPRMSRVLPCLQSAQRDELDRLNSVKPQFGCSLLDKMRRHVLLIKMLYCKIATLFSLKEYRVSDIYGINNPPNGSSNHQFQMSAKSDHWRAGSGLPARLGLYGNEVISSYGIFIIEYSVLCLRPAIRCNYICDCSQPLLSHATNDR